MSGPALRRRDVLRAAAAGAAGLAAAGCTAPAPAPAPPHPDDRLVAAALTRERRLLALYDAALAARPDLAARLRALRAEHAVHLEALQPPGPTASPTPGPTQTAASLPPEAALDALLVAEERAAREHAAAARTASGGLAAVLASLAASEASHRVALT